MLPARAWSCVVVILCWPRAHGEPWARRGLQAEVADALCLLQTAVHRSANPEGGEAANLTASHATAVQLDANASRMLELIHESSSEVAFETRASGAAKNKWIVSLLQLFGGGFFGLPRIYIGWDEPGHKNLWLGILQFFTLGGCGVWAAVDWIAFTVNSLQSAPSMDFVSITVSWRADTIPPARTIAIFQLIMIAVLVFLACCLGLFGVAAIAIERIAPRASSKPTEQQKSGEH
mmetsp:Transcript_45346/g.105205  ORF Transcript_45346/g.105205 Transcript_45346/m.105205 type:complete len:234 (-) Transcript_45346:58-759(-)